MPVGPTAQRGDVRFSSPMNERRDGNVVVKGQPGGNQNLDTVEGVPEDSKLSPDDEAAPQSESLRVEFKTDLADLPPLAERWEAFNRRQTDHDAPFFQSYAWNHHVASVRSRCSPHHKLLIATVWRGSDLVGVWPLALRRSAGLWMARSLDDPFGQLAGVSFQNKADIAPGVAAILSSLRGRADGLQIEGVVADSALHAALSRHGAISVSMQEAVIVDLRPYPTFQAFEQSIKGKDRKVLRKRADRLRQAHDVERVVVEDRAQIAPLLIRIFDERLQWLQHNGRTSPAFRDVAFRTLIGDIIQADIELVGFVMATKLALISAQWGFVYAGRFYAYMSTKNSEFDEFSPGRLLYRMVIESCFGRGVRVLELMPPASRDKVEWSPHVKQVETMTIPFNLKARVVMRLAHWVVFAARRASRAVPGFVRKPLVRRLNRI